MRSEFPGQGSAERILVVRFSSLGDVLLTAPALRALRARFPDAHIDLLVAAEYAEAASLLPGPNRVLTFDRRTGFRGLLELRARLSRRYTIFVDLQNSLRSAFLRTTTFPALWVRAHRYRLRRWLLIRFKWNTYRSVPPVPLRYLNALDAFGVRDDGRGLELHVPEAALLQAADVLHEPAGDPPLVVLCPGARHATKRWPAERWNELVGLLCRNGFRAVVVGSDEEQDLVARVVSGCADGHGVCGRSVRDMAVLFQRAKAVVAHDSGMMHLAAGVGAPVVALFGPTVEEFGFFPFRARSQVIEHRLDCRPCSAMGSDRCPKKHFRCLLDTSAATVLDAITTLTQSVESRTT